MPVAIPPSLSSNLQLTSSSSFGHRSARFSRKALAKTGRVGGAAVNGKSTISGNTTFRTDVNDNNNTDNGAKAVAWEKFRNTIARYARTNDRRMMIRAVKDCPRLRFIPMDFIESFPSSPDEWSKCEREVSKSILRINGTPMGNGGSLTYKAAAANKEPTVNNEMSGVIKRLCEYLASAKAPTCGDTLSSSELYQEVMIRLLRSAASADAYFQLNGLLGCSDLVVQPPKKAIPLPTDLTIYRLPEDGTIHITAITRHPYGLFRKTDLTGSPSVSSSSSGGKRPWVRLIAEVYERANLSTGESIRYCTVKVQEKL